MGCSDHRRKEEVRHVDGNQWSSKASFVARTFIRAIDACTVVHNHVLMWTTWACFHDS